MIKPEFFDDPDMAALTPLARLFFIGLWTQADRDGRLVDDMRRLKARIFPYDAVDVEDLALELVEKDLIRRYAAGEPRKAYIWIRTFTKHQRPHPKEPLSTLPPCPVSAVKKHGKPWKNTASRVDSGVLILGSGTQTPQSADAHTRVQEATANALHVSEALTVKHRELRATFTALRSGFAEFWERWPPERRIAKKKAEKEWDRIHPDDALKQKIYTAEDEQRQLPDWNKANGQYIPHPANWLKDARYNDERPPPAVLADVQVMSKTHARLAAATADFLQGES